MSLDRSPDGGRYGGFSLNHFAERKQSRRLVGNDSIIPSWV